MDGKKNLPEKDNIYPTFGSSENHRFKCALGKGDVLVSRERTVTVLMIVQKNLGENPEISWIKISCTFKSVSYHMNKRPGDKIYYFYIHKFLYVLFIYNLVYKVSPGMLLFFPRFWGDASIKVRQLIF